MLKTTTNFNWWVYWISEPSKVFGSQQALTYEITTFSTHRFHNPNIQVIESIVFPPPMPQAPNLSKGDHNFRFQVELLVVIVGSNNLSTINIGT